MSGDPAVLEKVTVKLDLGFFAMDTEWVADPRERQAAWELFVELASRIAAQPLDPQDGSTREALSSLHSLFATTRGILRAAGPVAGKQGRSVGYVALSVLNHGLRPFLSNWHPKLLQWEQSCPPALSAEQHERAWDRDVALRGELEAMRIKMWAYANALAEIAGTKKSKG